MLLLDETARNEIFTQLHIDPEINFKILKPLGEGAYGAVFKALDVRDNQLVALKVMRFDPEECTDLLSEIRILRECNNEYIVNFKDTFHKDGNIWLAMEFCEGGSALDIVKVTKHTLSERQCQCVLYHTLKGLQYLHSKNLIHRDIKAANILVNKNGRCKLADFGVAKSVRASGAGTTIGSPYWMAPEVLGTENYDNSADIWSLGIVAIEMAIGKPPLSNYKPLQAMFMIPKNDPPTLPEEYIDDFSKGFIDFIAKCLNKNPQMRPTAKQLLQNDTWINKVSHSNTVEKELMPWIQKVMPLIEKDRDLKARMANQDESYDDSKWSDYTSSLHHYSRDGSTGNYGGTMVKNALGDTLNNGTLKIVPDDMEDHEQSELQGHTFKVNDNSSDPYADNGGTLVRKSTPTHSISMNNNTINIIDDENDDENDDNFDGGTMITLQTKNENSSHDNDNDNDNEHNNDISGDDEEDNNEYHENGFSPSSHDTPVQSPHHQSMNSGLTQTTATTAATNHQNNQNRRGGGYSIGKNSNISFDGNTMVRQNSTDDEEEDPFQGQTMYRAPTVDSPRGQLLSDDENNQNNGYNIAINDTDTVTSMGTTKPQMSVSPKTNITQFQPRSVAMSEESENVKYEPTRGYINKPSSPISNLTKSQPPMAKVIKSDNNNIIHNEDEIGSAGVMSVTVTAETKRGTMSKVKNGKNNTLDMDKLIADTDMPTSPIPQYKHMQILTDHDKIDGVVTVKGGGIIKPAVHACAHEMIHNEIKKLSILANQLDFTKLVTSISCMEHILLIIGVLSTWTFIISYITLECSARKRPREMQLFIFASAFAILFNLILNPFYFKHFNSKYVPINTQQLFEKIQPIPSSMSNINNMELRINDERPNNVIHNDVDISDDGSDSTQLNMNNNNNNNRGPKRFAFICLVWLLRIIALLIALALSYFIYLDLSVEKYTDFTRYCIVLLTLTLFVGNLPLMGHFMLYFRKAFLIYYLCGWIIVFSAEFAYFHFVRHVKQEYFATFIIVNVIFFTFHIIATTFFSYMVKHRTLYTIDPISFPNSNHYRIYFASDHQIHYSHAKDGYIANTISNTTPIPNAEQAEQQNTMRPYRTVTCCCNKLICDSHTLLRVQSYASAISFWSFLGIIYTIGFEYVVFASCLFMLINTIWNPLFYSKEVVDIKKRLPLCCSFKRWFYYVMLCVSYVVGFVLNIAWFTFSISAFILEDGKQIQHATIINIIIFLFATLIFFLPAIGYSFYRIPISYGISNIFGALFCFFIPICISFQPHINDDHDNQAWEDWFFIYDISDSNVPTYLGIIVCAVVFSLYLVFTGASCVVYRLRKALVERSKIYFTKEFPMNMCMFWSFLLSFIVLTANSLWVFGDNFDSNHDNNKYDSIAVISKVVYIITFAVQCSSLFYAIFTLKHKFDDNPLLKPYLSHVTDKIRNTCGFCCFLFLFPIIYVSYIIFIILISLCLGITKLLTIRQVREFWLSFLIANFDANDTDTNHRLPQKQSSNAIIKSVATNSELVQTNTNRSINNNNGHNGHNVQIEVMSLNKQISLGEKNSNSHPNNNMNNNANDPTSPNTDFLDQNTDENTNLQLHRRVSSSVLQSVNMKVYKCCDCCTPQWMSSLFINECVYNNYLMSELIVESLPLLMLNLVNMFLLNNDRITNVSLIQAGASTLFLFYSIAKTLFFLRFHEWNLSKFLL